MSARRCFLGKMAAGRISERAGGQILEMLDQFEREHQARLGDGAGARQAALDAAAIAKGEAARKRDLVNRSIVAQSNVLRVFHNYDAAVSGLRNTKGVFGFGNQAPPTLGRATQTPLGAAMRSMLARDPWEVATWNNVFYYARDIRSRAHAMFADAIEFLRPKGFGLRPEATRELDVLRALYGHGDVDPRARAVADAWSQTAESLADQFRAEGGALAVREKWRLPNPAIDENKVRALGPDGFRQLVRDTVDRSDMLDFATGQPMNDFRFETLLNDATNSILAGGATGAPTGAVRGQAMLANQRDLARLFSFKDAESWTHFAETVGAHSSVYETMVGHIASMSDDIGMMRGYGPNPEATRRFVLDLFDREAGRLTQQAATNTPAGVAAQTTRNRAIEARVALERRMYEDLYAEVSGANRVPVSTTMATMFSDARAWLSATQLGSAIISSFTDPVTMTMTARFNGIPAMRTVARAVEMMGQRGSEVFAAQQGVILDSLAHAVGTVDRVMGENIRTGVAAKLSAANIRVSGLRRWTGILRASYALETMAHAARQRELGFNALEPKFRQALERYGIGDGEWDLIRATQPHEPRPGAEFIRSADIADRGAADRYSRFINTEMDYAVIEGDPVTRALLLGSSQPGTPSGELRRSAVQYKQFPSAMVTMHMARALARGWNGSRLGHAAIAFSTMTVFGAMAMQMKEVAAGRDPLSLDPTTANGARAWGKATMQGGGLGVFGDLMFMDQTKFGNSWAATLAGPLAQSAESVLGDWLIKNVQLAAKGKETHWAGDALYIAGRHMPGSTLWFSRLAFQREVLDQLALQADPNTHARFARIENQARQEWGQRYWWRPGQRGAERAPALGGGP